MVKKYSKGRTVLKYPKASFNKTDVMKEKKKIGISR